ncbi:4-hydroxyphenylpyruvate dioxygenase/hemolysin-like protein [Rhodobacteraceae bacterium HIMB11]|nr:4-hydroxyphenylpyruvate dioxygenase/hemolysin-like protein [Rhodobacteraceae bacterium HIMB11]
MKTSIATVSISGNLREKLEAIAAAGYDGIEIFEQDFVAYDGSPRDVGNMVRDHGLEITLFQPFRDFEGLPEPMRAKAFERAKRKFDLMQELGTDLVLICSSCHASSLGGIDRAAADFNALGDIAKDRGIRVGYEALAWGKHINDHRDAWEIVRRADHSNVGLILDSFHTLSRKIDPATIRSIPGDKIFFVQLADAPLIEMDLLYWSRHFRNMPGEGDLNVQGFMQAVMATGYSGPVSLEIFNDQFRGGSSKLVAVDGYRSLISLMDDVRRAEPNISLDLPNFPRRSETAGLSFVEFASRGDEAQRLGGYLESMGFSKIGKHKNKAADLYQQGDIRIVLNQETSGHAATQWNARGTTVCDIGIEVASAGDTLKRAAHLGNSSFTQPTEKDELDIPAVRGLSGSVIHFVGNENGMDRLWETEFSQTADHKGFGLRNIDHLAQTMSYDDMLSWSLFYTSLFEMKKSPMVDVFDPDGLVRSQVVETADGALRVTLNGADTHRTLAGSFLAESFGASVQHLALACDDIFTTLEKMIAHGFETLPMPSNYYDDLSARFDLPAGLLDKMKRANVLFDQDDKGTLFQCYSKEFTGGLFFEIVQRDGDYQGYGAPNAPFRIAAQKRIKSIKGMPKV